jgi:hypothetical protein
MSKYRDSLNDADRADLDALTALRRSGYTGPVTDGKPSTEADTDPRAWAALQTGPFRQPGDPRNPR